MSEPPFDEPPAERLDFIRPRLTERIVRARDSHMAEIIRRLRVWLPGLAAAIILLLFIWPSLLPSFLMLDVVKNIPDLAIDNLRFKGVDSKNQPYSLTAATATRPSHLHGVYDLSKPEGEITLQNGTWLDGKADSGRYDENEKKVFLSGNVQIFRDNGYQITTDELHVNLNNSEAWGDKSVLIQGDFGTINGVGFHFMDSGHTVIIKGPAKAVLSLH
ncbi:MAG: LPS export ABC transporter periplasmic protein LptC [Bdellovibrionales bacterium]